MEVTCRSCAVPLTLGGRGRPRIYCSETCRKRVQRAAALPVELTSRPRWVRRFGKRPVTVQGFGASVTDPATWTTYTDVKAATRGDGIGFVLGNGIGCIDLDNVLDTAGRLGPAAAELLSSLPRTYVEISPSGRGLHILGLLPEAPGTVRTVNGVSVEVYSRDRYVTVTANRWPRTPTTLGDLTPALLW